MARGASLAGSLTGTTDSETFFPQVDKPIWLKLSGTWTGTVTLLRVTRDGAKAPRTYGDGSPKPAWTGNMQAPVEEESVEGVGYCLRPNLSGGACNFSLEQ